MTAEPALAGATTAGVLEIDLDALAANWRLLRDRHPRGAVGAVVKANAYGLGAAAVVPRLCREGCRHFFTATLDEALEIRPLIPDAMLVTLDGLAPGREAEYVAGGILPALGSLPEIDAWAAAAPGRAALLHIDTGMSRLGLSAAERATLAADPGRLAAIRLACVMTHLVSPERAGDPLNARQLARFTAAAAAFPGVPRSIAASSGMFLGAAYLSDLARPGAALYGVNPIPGRPNPMRQVVRLMGRVLQVRDIPAGETVGYNAVWQAARPSRIATVGIGYADGWHRAHSNRGAAFFDGRPVPLVGRVSMDLTTYDVTGCPDVAAGAWLELIGPHVPPDTAAAEAGTTGYEVLTSLGRRLARTYRPA